MKIRLHSRGLRVAESELLASKSAVLLRLSRFSPVLEEVCTVFELVALDLYRVRCVLRLTDGSEITASGIDRSVVCATERAASQGQRVLDKHRLLGGTRHGE